jgi:hypothetical protein
LVDLRKSQPQSCGFAALLPVSLPALLCPSMVDLLLIEVASSI